MLAAAIPQRENELRHLVIELKRPSVVVGPDELTQIQRYAAAVEANEQFDRSRTRWDFYLVTNSLNDFAERQTSQQGRELGEVYRSDNVSVWVMPWNRIIQDARHRLKFVQEALDDYMTSEDATLAYLRRRHGKHLPLELGDDQPEPTEQPAPE